MERDLRYENVVACVTPCQSHWSGDWKFSIEVRINGKLFGGSFYTDQKNYVEVYSYILDRIVEYVDELLEMNGYTREG